jgi:hypothetical protein
METIFVSIASYRDALCADTLANLFKMARHPERVFVGICQQNKRGDPECRLNGSAFPYRHNVRTTRMSHKDARGPTYARYMCAKLYQNEDYFMQVDSHSLFVMDWDAKAIRMVEQVEAETPSKKVVLSHYPPEFKDYKEDPTREDLVTHITRCYFNEDGILSFRGAVFKKPEDLPRRNAFIAGGFVFARGSLVREVPFDPHLPYLFTGEELLLSARYFTHGWDAYTPNLNLAYHAYTRAGEPKFWDDHRYQNDDVHKKVKMVAGLMEKDLQKIQSVPLRESIEKYGIGSERTLDEFYAFIGVDPHTKTVGDPLIEFYCGCEDSTNRSVLLSVVWVLVALFLFLVVLLLVVARRR